MLENLGTDNTKWQPRSGATVLSYIPGGNKQQQKKRKPYFRTNLKIFWKIYNVHLRQGPANPFLDI